MIIQSCCASSRLKKCAERNALALDLQPNRYASSDYGSCESSRKTSLVEDQLCIVDYSNENLCKLPLFVTENANVIEHLILDGNQFSEQTFEDLPRLERLTTLSLNANKVKNIGILLQLLQRKCPKLRFLSLIGNPGWPHPIKNDDVSYYLIFARAAAKLLPTLRFLDTISLYGSNVPHRSGHNQPYGRPNGRHGSAPSRQRNVA